MPAQETACAFLLTERTVFGENTLNMSVKEYLGAERLKEDLNQSFVDHIIKGMLARKGIIQDMSIGARSLSPFSSTMVDGSERDVLELIILLRWILMGRSSALHEMEKDVFGM
jgi:hypothetical protein